MNHPELTTTRRCYRCKLDLPLDRFGRNRSKLDGRSTECLTCGAAQKRARPKDDPGRVLERERARKRHYGNRDRVIRQLWEASLKRKYGITAEQYYAILEEQGGRCAICRTDNFGKRKPHVDHCHATGVVRGLLCLRCNSGIGNFRDDRDRLQAAIGYLNRHIASFMEPT